MAKFLINDTPRPIIQPLTTLIEPSKQDKIRYSTNIKLSCNDHQGVPRVTLLMTDELRAYVFENTDQLKRFRAALDNVIEAIELREFNVAGAKTYDMNIRNL